MKFLKSKFFIITLSIVLSIALITGILALLGFSGPIKLVLGTAAKPFSFVGSYFADAVNGFVEVFTDYDEQFHIVAWLALLLLVVDILILPGKSRLTRNFNLFGNKK